jgi:hypothetical protein
MLLINLLPKFAARRATTQREEFLIFSSQRRDFPVGCAQTRNAAE